MYKKNFIKKVIARIDFVTPVSLFTAESLSDAVSEIKKRFPISEQSTASRHDIEISKVDIKSSKIEFPEWVFHGADRNKMLKVNQLFIEVVLSKYTSDDDFRNDLIIPISQLLKIDSKIAVRRTGVRFVNIFDFPISGFKDAENYFSESITKHLEFNSDENKCIRSFLINEFLINDVKLRVQSGFFNPDYPAIIKRDHFVVDLDAYIDFPHQINDTEGYFTVLHDLIEKQFESLITQKLRDEVLNV